MSSYLKIIFEKIDYGSIAICKESSYIKETISVGFINSSVVQIPPSVCIGTRLNFLALVTKLSAPATAVINQLSWHTIKKWF